MHIRQEEYTFEFVKEKVISYFIIEEFYRMMPILTWLEFEALLSLIHNCKRIMVVL